MRIWRRIIKKCLNETIEYQQNKSEEQEEEEIDNLKVMVVLFLRVVCNIPTFNKIIV